MHEILVPRHATRAAVLVLPPKSTLLRGCSSAPPATPVGDCRTPRLRWSTPPCQTATHPHRCLHPIRRSQDKIHYASGQIRRGRRRTAAARPIPRSIWPRRPPLKWLPMDLADAAPDTGTEDAGSRIRGVAGDGQESRPQARERAASSSLERWPCGGSPPSPPWGSRAAPTIPPISFTPTAAAATGGRMPSAGGQLAQCSPPPCRSCPSPRHRLLRRPAVGQRGSEGGRNMRRGARTGARAVVHPLPRRAPPRSILSTDGTAPTSGPPTPRR
ncbi:unnamed protein product [Urochloa humidicola]